MSNQLHRIYQGRVNGLQVKRGTDWVDVGDAGAVLLSFHELFQDAVNYYLVALAAMASDPSSAVGKLRRRMSESWEDFLRRGELRPGMKRSLARTLGTGGRETLTLQGAFDRVLEGNKTDARILNLAVGLVARNCEGESGVQQNGRTYLPRFCDSNYRGSWDYDAKSRTSAVGTERLVAILGSAAPVQAVFDAHDEMLLGWAGVKTQADSFFEGGEAVRQIRKAIQHFRNLPQKDRKPYICEYLSSISDLEARLDSYEARLESLTDLRIERNNKADLNRKNAFLLLKYFPDDFTVGLMRTIPLGEKPRTKRKADAAPAVAYDAFGDDPIKLARGTRGYVFPAFTSLPIFAAGQLWKPFDIEAFKEALKTVNQFNQKTAERQKGVARLQSVIDWMDGKSDKRPEAEDEGSEEEGIGVLGGDPRWQRLQDILTKDLMIANELSDGEAINYGLRPRTIRGFHALRQEWQRILDKCTTASPEDIHVRLKEKLNRHQADHRDDMGSATFFHRLIEPANWEIWRLPEGEHAVEIARNNWSQDVVADAVRYYEASRQQAELQEPISFTPADARRSRRLCNLSDLGSWRGKEFGHDHGGPFTCRIPMAMRNVESGLWERCTARIHYAAPRLLRDGLRQDSPDEQLDNADYLPPMAVPLLGDSPPAPHDFRACPVQLMPDWDKDGRLRVLLNFPLTVDAGAIQKANPSVSRWHRQFLYANSTNTMLLWPGTDDKQRATWFKEGKPFQVLAVDLGQRTAGAAVLIDVTPHKPSRGYPRKLGQAGDTIWYAQRTGAELLRLPGEDVRVWRDGKWQVELSGSSGRNATEADTDHARVLCVAFGQDPDDLLAGSLAFPEQNDKLIVAARRAQSRLARLNRWLWMFSDETRRAAAMAVVRECDEYNGIPEDQLLDRLRADEAAARASIPGLLLQLTNRVLPLRGRQWQFIQHPGNGVSQKTPSFLLCQTQRGSDATPKDICGQRGISFARIGQLEELRKRWQSLNRTLMRAPGARPESARQMRDNQVPDPCPDILRRLDAMREQRVNQTAHLIVASALGIRLRKHDFSPAERFARDIHGEYERIPGRSPVAFIVMENLSRYLSSQGRSPTENSRLMNWAHRYVLAKVKMLCEPFGIAVVEVPAAFSSRFCSATGIPGFRAVEVTAADRGRFPWRKLLAEAASEKPSSDAASCAELFRLADANPGTTLLAPMSGGPVFVPVADSAPTTQADINAAFNIGLRALAAPDQFHVHQRIRAEKAGGCWIARGKGKLDMARFGGKGETITYTPADSERRDVSSKSIMNFFVDLHQVAAFDRATFESGSLPQHLTTNQGLWGTVKDLRWGRCLELNRRRLEKLNGSRRTAAAQPDDIPM